MRRSKIVVERSKVQFRLRLDALFMKAGDERRARARRAVRHERDPPDCQKSKCIERGERRRHHRQPGLIRDPGGQSAVRSEAERRTSGSVPTNDVHPGVDQHLRSFEEGRFVVPAGRLTLSVAKIRDACKAGVERPHDRLEHVVGRAFDHPVRKTARSRR